MTVLAYGQTGSGKTHTIFGKERKLRVKEDLIVNEKK